MIYTNKDAILPDTLKLLAQLQKDPLLEGYFLVGVYFYDIDFQIEQPLLTRRITFKEVQDRLISAAKAPGIVF